ncbi:hypothetical protein [Galactobacillus timonensis]|uniref:hypothetical protein n=1 Tax=Galactobacillus timonensis TaxID=2041840 RepID=UPI00240A5157|nr:hypothetical protein [Galactobacillus timonensis]MDD6370655.1 hypothetical protein [Galactobacillus timonensis]
MNRFLGKLIASAAAAAAVGVIAAVYNNRKEANEEVKKDDAASDDDAVSFIDIEDGAEPASPETKPEEEAAVEEEKPADEQPVDEQAEEEKPEETQPAEEEAAGANELDAIAQLYPYLSKEFIAQQFAKNVDYNREYPADTLVRLIHTVQFDDPSALTSFEEIARRRGYEIEPSGDHEVKISRRLFTENGAILSDIYNVANQTACLNGSWLGVDIVR